MAGLAVLGQVWRQVLGQAWPRGPEGGLVYAPLAASASGGVPSVPGVVAAIMPCSHLPALNTPTSCGFDSGWCGGSVWLPQGLGDLGAERSHSLRSLLSTRGPGWEVCDFEV